MLASTLIIRVKGVWVCSRNQRCLVSWVLCLPYACRMAARNMSAMLRRRAAVGLWHDAVQLEPSSCYTPIHQDMYLHTHAHSNAHTHAQYLTHHITRTQRLFEQHVRDKPFCTPEICLCTYLYVYVYIWMYMERGRPKCTWKEGKRSTVSAHHKPVWMSAREGENKELTRSKFNLWNG